jgi:hypothetical protein
MRTRRFTLALVAILAALAALAACGGEDGGLGNRSLGDERSNDESSNDEESSDDTSPDDTHADDESSSGGDGGEFCSLYDTYTEGANDILSGEASPDELRELYDAFDEIAGPLADAAPSEISDDVDTLIEVGNTMGDILEEHDYDVTEAMSDPALSEALNEDFIDASTNVDAYVSSNC